MEQNHNNMFVRVLLTLCLVCTTTLGLSPRMRVPVPLYSEKDNSVDYAVPQKLQPKVPPKLYGSDGVHGKLKRDRERMWSEELYKRDDGSPEAPPKKLHNTMSMDDLEYYFDTKSVEQVPEYEVTSPAHVSGSRYRRDAGSAKDPLQFKVQAFGEEFNLVVGHNDRLVTQGCVLDRVSNGSRQMTSCTETAPPDGEDNDCFYIGHSVGHNGSTVAVSTCGGLHGIISVPGSDHDLVIKPVKAEHTGRARRSTGEVDPHIVYKKKVDKRSCSAEDDLMSLSSGSPGVTSHTVSKRSARDLYLELALVADKTMYQAHKEGLRDFMLTVANVAAARFLDASLGRKIHLSIVKIQILEDDVDGLEIVEDARYTINSFCMWQEQYNPASDSAPDHYDGISLFTRLDLVHGSSGKMTTGLASTGGMCGVNTRCSIEEDTGLDMGLTLAHELGHSLGIRHDGQNNDCADSKNMMSTSGALGSEGFKWSACSREQLESWLSSGKGSCLHDTATKSISLPTSLPGVLYDVDDQCVMWLGKGSKFNSRKTGDGLCSQITCTLPKRPAYSTSGAMPIMEGSMCGDRKYCIAGKCVNIPSNMPAVDGGWGSWPDQWSECSRSCGGGIQTDTRECNNPKPQLGGKRCEGDAVRSRLCNVKPCTDTEQEFKDAQCAATNDQAMGGNKYDWIPFAIGGARACFLMCQPRGHQNLGVHRRNLNGNRNYMDGTQCAGAGSSDFYKCVKGKCQGISCDGHSQSSYKFDKCGICGGAGNSCQAKTGTFNHGVAQKWTTVTSLPKGSTGIHLSNKNKYSKMTLSVNGSPVFNTGGSGSAPSGEYIASGVAVKYRKAVGSLPEKLEITGPLTVDAEAQVYVPMSDARFQPDIEYEYHVSLTQERGHGWHTTNRECSAHCGGGHYDVEITCRRKRDQAVVADRFCNIYDKPDSIGAACNTQECDPQWEPRGWGACSKRCGGGTQTRNVNCVVRKSELDVEQVAEDQCPAHRKPAVENSCNMAACGADWDTTDWSECSLTCGKGTQHREAKCVGGSGQVAESNCMNKKPDTSQTCVTAICDYDTFGDSCTDVEPDCEDYDVTMCEEYGDWAKVNCALTCSFCSKEKQERAATETGDSSCVDVSADCSGYGKSICTGEYADWAEANCANYCDKCAAAEETVEETADEDPNCVDANAECAAYGKGVCEGEYAAWAKTNCAKFCNKCEGSSSSSSSSSSSCTDAITDCADYGKGACTSYADWAGVNCQSFCNLCAGDAGKRALDVSSCSDQADCDQYAASVCTDYADWAKTTCPKKCNLCGK